MCLNTHLPYENSHGLSRVPSPPVQGEMVIAETSLAASHCVNSIDVAPPEVDSGVTAVVLGSACSALLTSAARSSIGI